MYIAHYYVYFEFWNQQKHKIILQRHVGLNGHLLVEISFTTGSIFFSLEKAHPISEVFFYYIVNIVIIAYCWV